MAGMMITLFSCGYTLRKKPKGTFKYYEYRSSVMGIEPEEYYRLEYKEDVGLTLSWAKDGSETETIQVPDTAAQEVSALIMKYKLYRLKKSYQPAFDVYDGRSWHVYFRFGEDMLNCSGYHTWPSGKLLQGIREINEYFQTLIQ